MLLLQHSGSADGLPLLSACNALPIKNQRLEPAGYSFHVAVLRLLGLDSALSDDEGAAAYSKDDNPTLSGFQDSVKGKKKSKSGSEQQDHYALLGLGHLRFLATEEQIRKAYREVALKHHPDKQAALILLEETAEAKEAKKVEIDSHFKAIQEAYEVLVDPVKRRAYDSVDEFDDEIPCDCAPEDFFKVYGPVFLRNARWSLVQPALGLGEDDTPLEEVDRFYDFWYGFKSWREFPHADEFELDQAESREHKRWMERQNAKLREKAKKEESTRVRTLVENAYKRDPRILRRKEDEKAEKLKRKQAKLLAKKEKEEEAAKVLEEERMRKEEEEKRLAEEAAIQKKLREKEKKQLRKERSRLRVLAAALASNKGCPVKNDDVELLCTSLDLGQLKTLCDSLEGKDVGEQARTLQMALAELRNESPPPPPPPTGENNKTDDGSSHAMAMKSSEPQKAAERPWQKEEVDLLRKAVVKFPKGTSQRWEAVSNYIGTGRTVEEILKAVKTVLLQKPDSSKAFDTFLEKRKPPSSIVSPLSTREQEGAAAAAATNGDVAALDGLANGDSKNGLTVEDVEDIWSETQQLALVKALKTFPKETNQRWERIAAAVPGKTKAQCFKKFTALRENFRSKK